MMLTSDPSEIHSSVLQTILADESYRPSEPANLADTGLPHSLVEGLVCKRLSMIGLAAGRQLADDVGLPFNLMESIFGGMRSRQIIVHKGSAPLNDYVYGLTENGQDRARLAARGDEA